MSLCVRTPPPIALRCQVSDPTPQYQGSEQRHTLLHPQRCCWARQLKRKALNPTSGSTVTTCCLLNCPRQAIPHTSWQCTQSTDWVTLCLTYCIVLYCKPRASANRLASFLALNQQPRQGSHSQYKVQVIPRGESSPRIATLPQSPLPDTHTCTGSSDTHTHTGS